MLDPGVNADVVIHHIAVVELPDRIAVASMAVAELAAGPPRWDIELALEFGNLEERQGRLGGLWERDDGLQELCCRQRGPAGHPDGPRCPRNRGGR